MVRPRSSLFTINICLLDTVKATVRKNSVRESTKVTIYALEAYYSIFVNEVHRTRSYWYARNDVTMLKSAREKESCEIAGILRTFQTPRTKCLEGGDDSWIRERGFFYEWKCTFSLRRVRRSLLFPVGRHCLSSRRTKKEMSPSGYYGSRFTRSVAIIATEVFQSINKRKTDERK